MLFEQRMSETRSSVKNLPESDGPEDGRSLLFPVVAGGILLALAVAVVMLRLYRLAELPPGVDLGEGANGLDALRVLRGEHAVFFPEKLAGREGLLIYMIALAFAILGKTEFALRLPSALASAGTVFAVFSLGRILFGQDREDGTAAQWRGLAIGGVGAGLMAVSVGQTIMGRIAFRTTLLPFLLCLCLATLWLGWRQRSWSYIVLSGLFAGLLPYTYIPGRLAPILLLLLGLSFVIPFGPPAWAKIRAELPLAFVFTAVVGLVAAPILIYFALHPDTFMARGNEVSVANASRNQGVLLTAILVNFREHLLTFGFRGDPTWRNNFAGKPMLNPVETIFFWLGVCMAMWRWQHRPAYRLLLLWLGTMILPALLARHAAPNTMRMIGAAPAVYLFIGIGMWETYIFLRMQFFRPFSSAVDIVGAACVGALIAFQGVSTFHTYFQYWARAPDVYKAHQVEWAVLAQTLNVQRSGDGELYLLPYRLSEHYGFDYLYQGSAPAHVIRSSPAQHVRKQLESVMDASDHVSTVKVVDWKDHIVWSQDGDSTLQLFLSKYGKYVASQEYADFQIHTFTDIEHDRLWRFYDYLEPLTIHYDGGVSLLGFALGQGPQQISSQDHLHFSRDRSWWIAMQWRTAPGLDIVYSTSLRLHDSEGRIVYQNDSVLEDATPSPTNRWQADERVDTLQFLEFPPDLKPGKYELRLIVYDFESLKPTVELGVWEPEAVIANLQISETK